MPVTSQHRSAGVVAIALLVTVASQIFYISIVSGSDNQLLRPLTWFVELFAFAIVAIGAQAVSLAHSVQRFAWIVIAMSGTLNLLQVAMGLSMFGPAQEASESTPELFATVLAGAFFLYFFAKVLVGYAAIVFGLAIFRAGSGVTRYVGPITGFAGIVAMVLNLLAMIDAEVWTFAAGAAGTAATALLAAVLLWLDRNKRIDAG